MGREVVAVRGGHLADQRHSAVLRRGRNDASAHAVDFADQLPSHVFVGFQIHFQNRLQQLASAAAQAVHEGHGRSDDEIQRVRVNFVIAAADKADMYVVYLPAEQTLPRS